MIRPAGKPLALVALAACAPEPEPLPYISEKALAALPPRTDLRTVQRRYNGCYVIQTEDELTGYLKQVTDANGNLVCDDV